MFKVTLMCVIYALLCLVQYKVRFLFCYASLISENAVTRACRQNDL